MKISVQEQDFSHQQLYNELRQRSGSQGAVVTFTGLVRDVVDSTKTIAALELEHYPKMTAKYLEKLAQEANNRWDLGAITIVHRVGKILLDEQIVFVGVTSAHRREAFEACWFLMDKLKTEAPFWKKEITNNEGDITEHWVEAKSSDQDAVKKW